MFSHILRDRKPRACKSTAALLAKTLPDGLSKTKNPRLARKRSPLHQVEPEPTAPAVDTAIRTSRLRNYERDRIEIKEEKNTVRRNKF